MLSHSHAVILHSGSLAYKAAVVDGIDGVWVNTFDLCI